MPPISPLVIHFTLAGSASVKMHMEDGDFKVREFSIESDQEITLKTNILRVAKFRKSDGTVQSQTLVIDGTLKITVSPPDFWKISEPPYFDIANQTASTANIFIIFQEITGPLIGEKLGD